jgi:prephenate dehydrogenase
MWLPGSLIRFGKRVAFLIGNNLVSCNITMMNRAAVIEQLKQTQEMLAKLLALLEAGEADKFAAHVYQSRRQYRCTLRATEQG